MFEGTHCGGGGELQPLSGCNGRKACANKKQKKCAAGSLEFEV